jgi:hypothetical protein
MSDIGDEPATVMGLLAGRVGMTEGQLYTVLLVALGVLLLSVLGLPGAGEPPDPAATPSATSTQEAP